MGRLYMGMGEGSVGHPITHPAGPRAGRDSCSRASEAMLFYAVVLALGSGLGTQEDVEGIVLAHSFLPSVKCGPKPTAKVVTFNLWHWDSLRPPPQ